MHEHKGDSKGDQLIFVPDILPSLQASLTPQSSGTSAASCKSCSLDPSSQPFFGHSLIALWPSYIAAPSPAPSAGDDTTQHRAEQDNPSPHPLAVLWYWRAAGCVGRGHELLHASQPMAALLWNNRSSADRGVWSFGKTMLDDKCWDKEKERDNSREAQTSDNAWRGWASKAGKKTKNCSLIRGWTCVRYVGMDREETWEEVQL